jgi:hypothetical protein
MRIKFTEKAIERLIKNRRGQGEGKYYTPFITVRDISSKGRSRRVAGLKIERTHHFFSDIEYDFFLALEWNPRVLDIREQFPLLNRDESTAIAKSIGVRHPCYRYTNVPIVVTVDFMVTVLGKAGPQQIAFDTKPWSKARDARTLEKLEIARRYLAARSVPHHLVLDSQLDRQLARNVEWVRGAEPTRLEVFPYASFVVDVISALSRFLTRTIAYDERPLNKVCSQFDLERRLPDGTGLRFARVMLNRRLLEVDMSLKSVETTPLARFSFPDVAVKTARSAA